MPPSLAEGAALVARGERLSVPGLPRIAVVVPAFNVADEIERVVRGAPAFVHWIIVVDDCSTDRTNAVLASLAMTCPRLIVVRHSMNAGVGGATVSGFRVALDLGAEVVVKLDGDGQMAWEDLPLIMAPIIAVQADYAKGNRFRDFSALRRMPWVRRSGNLFLSFLAKASTGYWSCFDPTNGFFAIRREALELISLDRLDRRYFFEHSILGELYLVRARVVDCPLPARYGDETSHLSIAQVALSFPMKLLKLLVRRLVLCNLIYDFSLKSLLLVTGLPLVCFALLFGGYHWLRSLQTGIPAPTGTVILPALTLILGIQFLLVAVALDLQDEPRQPLCRRDDGGFPEVLRRLEAAAGGAPE